ncbi:MAG: MurR/RpiR family transcriptional regulator [Acidovorax sp.]|jgi:DNA-binding MurR/RpiR family transcriptional regulator|nr:MurR/RpiR family transcriptional regulator [Acidovorax sp.]MDR3003452.1 MurR/RpiR family transcriptional regulator [Acidovorax sp.]
MDLMHHIAEKLPSLGAAEQRLAEFVRANPHSVAFVSARTLAAQAGVSPATVVRFFPRLGYASYAEAQQQLQTTLAGQYEAPGQRLTGDAAPRGALSVAQQALEQDLRNLQAMTPLLQSPGFAQLLTWLSTCQGRVAVVGGRYSRGPAQLLANQLAVALPTELVDPEQSASERLQDYGAQDLVLCLSVRRYLRSTLEIARWLRTRDVPVVAFTDDALAPIALHCDLPLVLPTQGAALFDSYTAFTAMGNALVGELSLSRRATVAARAQAREQLDAQLGLYPGKPRS